MNLSLNDTIAAVATPIGIGGIGIVRISGNNAFDITKKIFTGRTEFKSHSIVYGNIINEKNEIIDEVLVSSMKAPNTYTTEDVIEINCHGSIISIQTILELVIKNGARLAEPGEFTKRAFLNGRIDISSAEAVTDVINAKTELALKTSISRLRGGLYKKIKLIRENILQMVAHIEASIDYPEHDLEEMNIKEIHMNSLAIKEEIKELLNTSNKGKIIENGIETVIVGKPNVGKSSFLNFILDEERAIVTDIPGTTRDTLSENVNIEGVALKLIDTAGIRDTEDIIEKIGVEKTNKYIENADFIIFLLDASRDISVEDVEILEKIKNKKVCVLVNKSDLKSKLDIQKIKNYITEENIIYFSTKTGIGSEKFYQKVKDLFNLGEINVNEEIYISNLRHKAALENALNAIERVITAIDINITEDLISIDLQEVYNYLGQVTGETLEEDIIDKIFKEFCLGK